MLFNYLFVDHLNHLFVCRHSFECSDGDESITAHLVGGIDAFIKIPQSWPMSDSGLKLVSIKNSNIQSKSISLSFLYKIKVSHLVGSLLVLALYYGPFILEFTCACVRKYIHILVDL